MKINILLTSVFMMILWSSVESMKIKSNSATTLRVFDKKNYVTIGLKRDEQDPSLGMTMYLYRIFGDTGKNEYITFNPSKIDSITNKESPEITNKVYDLIKKYKTASTIIIVGHWSQFKLLNTEALIDLMETQGQEAFLLTCGCQQNFIKRPKVVKFCAEGIITGGYDGSRYGLFEFNFDSGIADYMWSWARKCLIPSNCYQPVPGNSVAEKALKSCYEKSVVMSRYIKGTPTKSFFHYFDGVNWVKKEFLSNPKDDVTPKHLSSEPEIGKDSCPIIPKDVITNNE
jgi:hypothetical protein